jgi:hypothetical protein
MVFSRSPKVSPMLHSDAVPSPYLKHLSQDKPSKSPRRRAVLLFLAGRPEPYTEHISFRTAIGAVNIVRFVLCLLFLDRCVIILQKFRVSPRESLTRRNRLTCYGEKGLKVGGSPRCSRVRRYRRRHRLITCRANVSRSGSGSGMIRGCIQTYVGPTLFFAQIFSCSTRTLSR